MNVKHRLSSSNKMITTSFSCIHFSPWETEDFFIWWEPQLSTWFSLELSEDRSHGFQIAVEKPVTYAPSHRCARCWSFSVGASASWRLPDAARGPVWGFFLRLLWLTLSLSGVLFNDTCPIIAVKKERIVRIFHLMLGCVKCLFVQCLKLNATLTGFIHLFLCRWLFFPLNSQFMAEKSPVGHGHRDLRIITTNGKISRKL